MTSRQTTFFACTIVCLCVFHSISCAVDGIAVSVRYPYLIRWRIGHPLRGSIQRFDIKDNTVVDSQIIYSCADGIAHMPCISQDGKKVAFFRDGQGFDNCQITGGGGDYVSIMDIDGSNIENLVQISSDNVFDNNSPDRLMDWPAGDWIYYQKPKSAEVWRVNINTKENEKVATYPSGFWRWNLSADGSHAIARADGNYASAFPSLNNRCDISAGGCNHCLSASGRFISGYGRIHTGTKTVAWPYKGEYRYDNTYEGRTMSKSGHNSFDFAEWKWDTQTSYRFGDQRNDRVVFRHISYMLGTRWLKEQIGRENIGDWCEFIRWAANSDKWVLQRIYESREGISNQVLYNWVDREAILTSRNGSGAKYGDEACYTYCNTAGDFWVQPPKEEYAGTRIEECDGSWMELGQESTAPLPGYVECPECDDAYECALKYDSLVIMPQNIYDMIDSLWALTVPDFSTLVVKPNNAIDLTVTDQWYDPIFGEPTVEWSLVGLQGGTFSSASGLQTTFNADGTPGQCEVKVDVTIGNVTQTTTKQLVIGDSSAIATSDKIRYMHSPLRPRLRTRPDGALNVRLPGAMIASLSIYNAAGVRIAHHSECDEVVIIPAKQLSPGVYLLRVNDMHGRTFTIHHIAI